MSGVVTPAQVEQKLISLSREYDDAHKQLESAETRYAEAKTAYEIEIARSRMGIGQRALEAGRKVTVQEKEDEALIQCADLYTEHNIADATVRAARANATRLRTQIDITRSVGTAVRAALDI
jgi:hypothetical protein